MTNWKVLLLLYAELRVRLPSPRRRFHHLATEREIADAVESFAGFPQLVRELTDGVVTIEPVVEAAGRALQSLTRRGTEEWWPSPDDTRPELDRRARAGTYDSVFVFWPQHDFAAQTSVKCHAWGLGMGASAWSNGATYATVANAPSSAWRGEVRGEVWLHEWLHGVCHHFGQRGLTMPERDADGAELHGYTRSPERGWTDYYRDLMNGNVLENGKRLGINLAAWTDGKVGAQMV